jgi:hypothetical protein
MEGRRKDALKQTAEKANLRHHRRGLAGVLKAGRNFRMLVYCGTASAAFLAIFTSYSPFGRYVCCRRQIFRHTFRTTDNIDGLG